MAGLQQTFAQKQVIDAATEFIKQNNYTRANQYLDSVLKKHPYLVDAYMMKGNVLLNYSWANTTKNYFNIERAESVFDTTGINESFFVPIIPEDTSRLIENYWLHCLKLDSTRNDIRKGLCRLYSISLRVNDLKKQLGQMKSLITENEDNAYIYAEYARNIKLRGRFDEALSVYQFLANMFPGLAGIRCDMSGECFYNGRPNEALRYLDSSLSQRVVDQTSFINAATIYSLLGYYEDAFTTFKRYSQTDTLLMGDFYKGLMMFAKMDSGFYNQLYTFLQKADEKSYYDEVQLARKLVPYGKINFTMDDYLALINNDKIPAYYKALIYQRGLAQFKNDCTPFLMYGYFQITIKNFAAASQFLEDVDSCKTILGDVDYWKLAYAYSLYKSNDGEKALPYFSQLFNSPDVFRKQAAKYFSAKILIDKKQKYGYALREELLADKIETKYRWMATAL